jgi:hypothetical protein
VPVDRERAFALRHPPLHAAGAVIAGTDERDHHVVARPPAGHSCDLMTVDSRQHATHSLSTNEMSLWQIPQAATCTMTSPAEGRRTSISSTMSGSPNWWQTAARTDLLCSPCSGGQRTQ